MTFSAHSVFTGRCKCKYYSLHGINNYVNFGNAVNGGTRARAHGCKSLAGDSHEQLKHIVCFTRRV